MYTKLNGFEFFILEKHKLDKSYFKLYTPTNIYNYCDILMYEFQKLKFNTSISVILLRWILYIIYLVMNILYLIHNNNMISINVGQFFSEVTQIVTKSIHVFKNIFLRWFEVIIKIYIFYYFYCYFFLYILLYWIITYIFNFIKQTFF